MAEFVVKIAIHLTQAFPSAPKAEIESFSTNAAMGIYSSPTPDQLIELENRFAIHLTLIDQSAWGSKNESQGSMDSLAERPQNSQSMDLLAERPQTSESMANLPYQLENAQRQANFQYLTHEPHNRAVDILNNIQLSFEKEENFKQMCNTIFKGVKYFVQDPSSMVFNVIPLKYEELENNQGIFVQIQMLCSEFEIECNAKEKGALLSFSRNDPVYINHVQQILEAFKKHKDESIVKKNTSTNEDKKSFNARDPNRDERVAAFLEARRLRAVTGPQPIAIMDSPSTNPFETPSNIIQNRQVDYPVAPSGQQQSQPQGKQPWNGQGHDPIGDRFKYTVNDAPLTKNPHLAHQNQLNEYRNKARLNNHDKIEARPKFMNWGQLSDQIDIEDQEKFGKECLEWTNKFRASYGLRPLLWEQRMFGIGIPGFI